jgi:hypothetical protein
MLIVAVLALVTDMSAVRLARASTTTKPVSGDLSGVSCATSSLCFAVGVTKNVTGEIVKVRDGAPSKPVTVAGTASLFGIDCPTATFCEVVGTGKNGLGAILSLVNGKAGTVHGLDWAPQAASCPSAGSCVIAGSSVHQRGTLEAAVVSGGKVVSTHTEKVKNAYGATISDVSCPQAGSCEAIGSRQVGFSTRGLFLRVGVGATLGAVHVVKTPALAGIACPPRSAASCYVTGRASKGVLDSVKVGGTSLTKISSFSATVQRLSCLNLHQCTAEGNNDQQQPVIVSFQDGKPGAGQVTDLHSQYFSDVERVSATTWLAVASDAGGAGKSSVVTGTVA